MLLRLGRFKWVLGPGINWTFPGFDRLVATVDMRIRSTPFQAEKTLTKDTVPVNVDAVLFWVVTDAKKAVVEVEHYAATVSWAAQTTLRDVIGHTELAGIISTGSRSIVSCRRSSTRRPATGGSPCSRSRSATSGCPACSRMR